MGEEGPDRMDGSDDLPPDVPRLTLPHFKTAVHAGGCKQKFGGSAMTWFGNQHLRATAILNSDVSGAFNNVFHVKNTSGSHTNAETISAIGEWLEDVYTPIVAYLSEEVDFDAINMFIIEGAEALGNQPWPTLTVGTATGAMQASGVALLGSAASGIARRVARKYWGPGTSSNFLDSDWPTAFLSAAATAMQVAYSGYTATNGVAFLPVIYNRVLGSGLAAVSTKVVSNPAYQRRRRRGTGE